MSKEKGVEALDRYIRRLSSHPNADVFKSQQVAINISDKNNKFTLRSLCCMSKKNEATEQVEFIFVYFIATLYNCYYFF